MISRKMVRYGYDKNFIRLAVSPNGDGIVCKIGDGWFYFGGATAEEYDTVEAYTADIPRDTILDDIFSVLEAFREDGESGDEIFADEYLYYDLYLREWGVMDSVADDHAYILDSHPIEGTDDLYYVKAEHNESIYEMLILFEENGDTKLFYLDGRVPEDENFRYKILGQI